MKLYKFKLKLAKLIEEKYLDKRGREKSRSFEKAIQSEFIVSENAKDAKTAFQAQNPGKIVKHVYLVGEYIENAKEEKKPSKKKGKK